MPNAIVIQSDTQLRHKFITVPAYSGSLVNFSAWAWAAAKELTAKYGTAFDFTDPTAVVYYDEYDRDGKLVAWAMAYSVACPLPRWQTASRWRVGPAATGDELRAALGLPLLDEPDPEPTIVKGP